MLFGKHFKRFILLLHLCLIDYNNELSKKSPFYLYLKLLIYLKGRETDIKLLSHVNAPVVHKFSWRLKLTVLEITSSFIFLWTYKFFNNHSRRNKNINMASIKKVSILRWSSKTYLIKQRKTWWSKITQFHAGQVSVFIQINPYFSIKWQFDKFQDLKNRQRLKLTWKISVSGKCTNMKNISDTNYKLQI